MRTSINFIYGSERKIIMPCSIIKCECCGKEFMQNNILKS